MKPTNRKWLVATILLCMAVLALPALVAYAQDGNSRPATVENQTSDVIMLTYQESDGAYTSKNQVPLYPGERKNLNANRIQGEVCAWSAKEYQPTEKVGCRTLRPGDFWVIHP